jgi:hypothetical protein
MTGSDIGRAISSLRPGAPWVLRGDTLADLEWLDAGSPPTEAEISAEVARLAALDSSWATDVDRLDIIGKLKRKTPAEIRSYVQSIVTDLASAKMLLSKILLLLSKTV